MEEIPDNAKIAEVDLMMVVIVTVSASITANETAEMTHEVEAEAQEITEAEVKAKEVEANPIAKEEAVNHVSTGITDHQKAQAEAEDVVATISESREMITHEDEVTITAS